MDTTDRKAAVSAYKEQKTVAGICVVRCAAAGRHWLIDARNVDTHQNRVWFELRTGGSRDREMQAAWNTHGEAAFGFEILERLPDDISPMLLRTELQKRLAEWRQRLA